MDISASSCTISSTSSYFSSHIHSEPDSPWRGRETRRDQIERKTIIPVLIYRETEILHKTRET